ncbi:MAG TPA: alpha/beta hydrolase [Thermoleophilaceae bacterium]
MNLERFNSLRKTVSTRSGEVAYVDIGSGPTALFIHGVGTSSYLWHNVIDELQHERRCVALDLPLHGRTPAAAGQDFSLGWFARVVADFCDALELDEIDLVANDTGGAVAQIFATKHPERLATLTLTNCETHDNVPPKALKPAVILARARLLAPTLRWLTRRPPMARRTAFAQAYEKPKRLSDDTIREFQEPLLGTPERARQFQRLIASLHARDLLAVEPALRTLDVPTLVVWGTGDIFFKLEWAHWLRATIPGATEVVEIAGGRLFFPDERADEFVPHLRRHWSGQRPISVAA